MPAMRTQIEDAIVALLTPLSIYVPLIAPYNGEIGGADSADDIKEALLGQLPAILVSTGHGRYVSRDIRRKGWTHDLNVEILLCSGNMRSMASHTRGDVGSADPANDRGIYQMIEDVRNSIGGKTLAINGVGQLTPIEDTKLLHHPELSVWRIVYSVDADVAAAEPVTGTATEILAKGNLPAPDTQANPIVQVKAVPPE